jgi:hypothetical protein
MIAHRVIDALLERRGHLAFSDAHLLTTPERRRETAEKIRLTEKFDFGPLLLEANPDHTWHLPALTRDEHEFLADGLLPLPFDTVWYEFTLGGTPTGLLVEEKAGAWLVERLDLTHQGLICDGITVRATLTEQREKFSAKVVRNELLAQRLSKSNLFTDSNVSAMVPLAAYLTLMLLSRSTEVEHGLVPPKLVKASLRRGYEPLPAHRVVHIVPREFRYERDPATGQLTDRRSPRLHWRRSHLRTYASGRRIVIARMLVGRAELGEVSHEYHIEKEVM